MHDAPVNADVSSNEPRLHWIFFGPNGLRAGWSVLLFVAIFLATETLLGWMLHPLLARLTPAVGTAHAGHATLSLRYAYTAEILQASGAFVATGVMALIERRAFLAYGYQGRHRAIRFVSGMLLGFTAISILVLVLLKAGLLSLDGQVLHGFLLWKDAVAWAFLFLMVAIFEESTLRGFLQFTITRGLGFWWGAILLSLVFGFSHHTNPGETPVGLFSAGAIGLVFCLSLWHTGSLWWALGFHAAWDWGESYFYGTSDSGLIVKGHLFAEHPMGRALWSGGVTGPEGSLLVFPLLALIGAGMYAWWNSRAETPFRGSGWTPGPAVLPMAARREVVE